MSTGLCSDETHAFIPTNLPDPGPSLFSVGSIKLPTLIFVRKGCREVVLSIAWCLQLLLSTWKYTNLHGGPKKSKPQRHKVWLSSQKGWNAFQSFEVSWACSWEKLDRLVLADFRMMLPAHMSPENPASNSRCCCPLRFSNCPQWHSRVCMTSGVSPCLISFR